MGKGSRNPKPNHKQSGLETLKLGGSLSLSGPSGPSGSQCGWNTELPPRGLYQELNVTSWPPMDRPELRTWLSHLHRDFPILPYTSHSPCLALVLPYYKIISSSKARKPAFCSLRDAKEAPLRLQTQVRNRHSPHYTFSPVPEIPPTISSKNVI